PCTALSQGSHWGAALAEVGHRREGEFTVEGRSAPIFAGDFRARPPADWMMSVLARDLEGARTLDDARREDDVGRDRQELSAALRQALENFTRSDQLQANPLLRSRWV